MQIETTHGRKVEFTIEEQIKKVCQDSQIYDLNCWKQEAPKLQIENTYIQQFSKFWDNIEIKDEFEVFKTIYPPKITNAINNQLNQRMRTAFSEQSEKVIRKKMFKLDQIYEYFGVKILMGFIKVQEFDDYFNEDYVAQNKILECIKLGRFKCIETWTYFVDKQLLQIKNKLVADETCKRISKKFSKLQQKSNEYSQDLILFENHNFKFPNCKQILIIDALTQVILFVDFIYNNETKRIVEQLKRFEGRNNRIFFYDKILTVFEMVYLQKELQIYSIGIIDGKELESFKPNTYHPQIALEQFDQDIIAFTTYDPQSKKKYNQYLKNITYLDNHIYRCSLSYQVLLQAIQTECQEITIWNAWLISMRITEEQIEFKQFRLGLGKLLLGSKYRQIMSNFISLPLNKAKLQSVSMNTEVAGNFGDNNTQLQQSSFHIPTLILNQKQINPNMCCLVCRKQTSILSQCKSCTEMSGKFVVLCASMCFFNFHSNTHFYIVNGDDINFTQSKNNDSGMLLEINQN